MDGDGYGVRSRREMCVDRDGDWRSLTQSYGGSCSCPCNFEFGIAVVHEVSGKHEECDGIYTCLNCLLPFHPGQAQLLLLLSLVPSGSPPLLCLLLPFFLLQQPSLPPDLCPHLSQLPFLSRRHFLGLEYPRSHRHLPPFPPPSPFLPVILSAEVTSSPPTLVLPCCLHSRAPFPQL